MVYLLFFLSGAAGLVYEMAWSRQLGLLFGHTVNAAAVVLAAYFGGMALGYWLAARLLHRISKPLAAYGWAELLVCGWALVTPFVLAMFSNPLIAKLINHPDPTLQLAVRAGATFLVLLPATAAMGATLPFIAKHLDLSGFGRSAVALAYSCNTAGAVSGVLAATFVLILFAGVRGSGLIAAGLSGMCGLCALAMARGTVPAPAKVAHAGVSIETTSSVAIPASLYWLAGLSGAGALGFQVLYTKMFALVFHNSTYTFGLVVAVFLLALALGSWFVGHYSQRYLPWPSIAKALLLSPVAVVAGLLFFQYTTRLSYFTLGSGFLGYMLAALALVLITVLPPVAIMGVVLPYLWGAVKGLGAAAAVGRLTAMNTLAAAVGALGTSFVLLPLLGLWKCFALFALVYLATGIWLAFRLSDKQAVSLSWTMMFPVVAGVLMLQYLPGRAKTGSEVLYQRDTAYGIISVVEKKDGAELWLKQNLHYTLGATVGGDSELRQGHIPLLLHPAPSEVLFLGLATGITASSALMHPEVQSVVAVELIPEVVVGAKYFANYNGGVLDDPRFTVVVNDARHYLYATAQSYDVIISDLFVPWHSQTGYLYTVEHYRAARNKLKPGGLFCQWLPLYQLGPNELELIIDSFATVFPTVTLWRGEFGVNGPLLALVGSEEPVKVDGRNAQVRIANLPAPFTGTEPYLRGIRDLLDLYIGSWALNADAVLNTDEHPRLEFLAPVTHREKVQLTGDRLKVYYEQRLNSLPSGGLDYTPRRAEPMPTLGLGKLRQQSLEPQGE